MNEPNTRRGPSAAQWGVTAFVAASAGGSILYKLLIHEHLGQSAAMFVGIPALLAILLALTPKARSVTGGILKGITLALLIIAPLLGEGFLCILMASPLFFFIGIVVGLSVDAARKRKTTTLSCVALLLLPMSMEGVIPSLSFDRTQTVECTGIVDAPARAVEEALARSPRIGAELPMPLRIGFPRPLAARGQGLEPGALRVIHFAGAEGDPAGDLTMQVTQRGPGFVRFDAVSDQSKLTQWLRWNRSEVEWSAIDARHTRVAWRISFSRALDPAWYFTPMERAAVYESAKYLIEANATPSNAQ